MLISNSDTRAISVVPARPGHRAGRAPGYLPAKRLAGRGDGGDKRAQGFDLRFRGNRPVVFCHVNLLFAFCKGLLQPGRTRLLPARSTC